MSVLQAILVLSGITCMISPVISEMKVIEDEKAPSSNSIQSKKISEVMANHQLESFTRPQRYRRPHIERVWIMRSFGSDRNVSTQKTNFTDPIRSFAIAIRDPETFLRYLRQEERQLLANSSATRQRQHAASAVGGSLLLNMLSQELVGNMMGPSSNISEREHRSDEKSSLVSQSWSANETTAQNTVNNEHQNSLLQTEAHRRSDVQRYAPQLEQHDVQQFQQYPHREQKKQQRRRPRKQKQEWRQATDLQKQKVKTDEPLIVLGEFGQRLPNYTRPSAMREFMKSRTSEILPVPSIYLMPPFVTNFRHFNLQQPMLTITANAMKSSRRRKRPKTTTAPPTSDRDTVVPDLLQDSAAKPPKTSVSNPDRAQISERIDISPKVFAPRPFSSIPFSVLNPSSVGIISEPSQRTVDQQQISPEHQPVSPHVQAPVQSNPSASGLTQERNTYQPVVRITTPSIHLSPPVLDVYNSTQFPNAIHEDTQSSTQSQRSYVQQPQYTVQELRPTSFQSFTDVENTTNNLISPRKALEHSSGEQHYKRLQNQGEEKQEQPNYMAIIVDIDFMNNTKRRKSSRRRQPQHNLLIEKDYGELQLSAAETAYFKRQHSVMHPNSVLEHMEEIGSIPGTPGMDYPIFSRPPKTSFSCTNMQGRRGYFADVNTGCQVFYICSEEGRGEPMLCPNGTLFNQDFLVCDWWFNVACEGVS